MIQSYYHSCDDHACIEHQCESKQNALAPNMVKGEVSAIKDSAHKKSRDTLEEEASAHIESCQRHPY